MLKPVKYPPRNVALSLQPRLKKDLESVVEQGFVMLQKYISRYSIKHHVKCVT